MGGSGCGKNGAAAVRRGNVSESEPLASIACVYTHKHIRDTLKPILKGISINNFENGAAILWIIDASMQDFNRVLDRIKK